MRPDVKCITHYEGDDLVIRFVNFKYDLVTRGKDIIEPLDEIMACYNDDFGLFTKIVLLRIKEIYCDLYPDHCESFEHLMEKNKKLLN